MAHEINSIAYTNAVPWHGLGNYVTPGASIDTWAREAGMNWTVDRAAVQFVPGGGAGLLRSSPDHHVLYRSDTHAPLAVVSPRFKPVQPAQVLEFFREFAEAGHLSIETAGCLRGGAMLWALARTNRELDMGGDVVRGYYLLTTANDGRAATVATATSVRVVCANTLKQALAHLVDPITVRHTTRFDVSSVSKRLAGADTEWATFAESVRLMAAARITRMDAGELTRKALKLDTDDVETSRGYHKIMSLFDGHGRGSRMDSTYRTAWGWLNAVTEYVDHHAIERQAGGRLHSAWLGAGDALKTEASRLAVAVA